MATLEDIGVSAFINIGFTFLFLLGFAFIRIQPWADRVYNTKWYIKGMRKSNNRGGVFQRFVNLDARSYVTFLNWMPEALRMSQADIIDHAGLDSAVYLRIYILGMKIFVPVTIAALLFLIPVNVSGGTLLSLKKEVVFTDIDKLSISNVSAGSQRFWIHLLMEYLFTFWACFILYKEYSNVAFMRLHFLATQQRRAEQFTVVVSNVPHVSGHSISESVDQFFQRNHPEHYLGHQAVYNANKFARLIRRKERLQNWLDYNHIKFEKHPDKRPTRMTGFLGLCGEKVDAIDFYAEQIRVLDKSITAERQRVLKDSKAIMPVVFVTFDSRWAAAVCAQTQQSKDPTKWLTDWAPEPRDVYWRNLAIPFVSLSIRRLLMSISLFALVFFYMIPIAFVQSLANLEGLEKEASFLRPVIEIKVIKSFLQGFLPGLALKIFLYILPTVLMIMSKVEGHLSLSALERRTASKYYYFMLVNVFLGSIVTGTAFEQLYSFLHQSPTQIPRTIGVSIPMKATFFITFIMVDGWAGIASEILRLKPLIIFLLKNTFIVKTERDREKAMDPGSISIPETLPTLQLYFLLGLVYAVVTPILLPFVLVFFAFAYFVYRHQIINVYDQEYESAGAFWPHVHGRIIGSLLISQLLLLGLLSTKKAADSTPLLIVLPVLTIWFHKYCKSRFEPAFRKYPLEEAMEKDNMEKDSESNLNLKAFLADAYLHPIFHSFDNDVVEAADIRVDKTQSYAASPVRSEITRSEASSPSPPHYVYHYDIEP
ncbi:CSC1-like protein At1g32090 [Dioscorea cayenensis subsp. rotundata]|uniref:CSC1-like protein At1g32090 n=1 Tax=Dioscorea cayennensis subsp. rotundata TaxID=55577 RepID=A0AB40B5L4_DIOCR|nr:CSC1-like protein At1g32090 [Dioscorea cayenensis subsp. rotundata]